MIDVHEEIEVHLFPFLKVSRRQSWIIQNFIYNGYFSFPGLREKRNQQRVSASGEAPAIPRVEGEKGGEQTQATELLKAGGLPDRSRTSCLPTGHRASSLASSSILGSAPLSRSSFSSRNSKPPTAYYQPPAFLKAGFTRQSAICLLFLISPRNTARVRGLRPAARRAQPFLPPGLSWGRPSASIAKACARTPVLMVTRLH